MSQSRREFAQEFHARGMDKVATTPEPKGQKFPCGSRVRIADDLGEGMSHFTGGVNATVQYTYAHAYGGNDVKSYSLDIDGKGSVSWYHEHQLTKIEMAIGMSFAKDAMGSVSVVLGVDVVNSRLHLGTRERNTPDGMLVEKTVFANSYEIGYGVIRDDGSGRCSDDDPLWYDPWIVDDTTWEPFRTRYKEAIEVTNADISTN